LVNGKSDEGGLEEFDEFCPSCRFSLATSAPRVALSARNRSIITAWAATRAASSPYDGRSPPACTS
jgi:hypothetical protein